MTDPRSEAIRAMGEVIAAQAAHIENLEAGHWSKHTRKRVERTKRQLDQITAGDASYIAPRVVQPAPQAKIPEDGMFRTIEDIDNDVASANDLHPTHTGPHKNDTWPPTGECARCDALQPLWDERQVLLHAKRRALLQGGPLRTGSTMVKNTTGEDETIRPNHDAP